MQEMPSPGQGPATLADVAASQSLLRGELSAFRSGLGSEIRSFERKAGIELVNINGRISALKAELLAQMRQSESRILEAIQDFSGKSKDQDRTAVVHGEILKDHRGRLDEHESRLRGLEFKPERN